MRIYYCLSFFLFVSLQSCITIKLDTTPYQKTSYYQQTKATIEKYSPRPAINSDTVKVGWAKVNITPGQRAPMAGYGKRKGKFYEQIHDSVWVRVFVFNNGTHKVAWVTADLLIFPMSVRDLVQKSLLKKGYTPENTYLTATHTHYSFGGWGKKPAGRIMAGKYNHKLVEHISFSIGQAIEQAERTAELSRISYQEIAAPEFVQNRLVKEKGEVDSFIRLLRFQKISGKEALLITYSAHPTSIPSEDLRLSAEYPGLLVQLLEKQLPLDFAAFAAGAVGSHGAKSPGEGYQKVSNLAQGLALKIKTEFNKKNNLVFETNLQSAYFPLQLPKPQWRLGTFRRFRPWIFNAVFGSYSSGISMLQIGSNILIGTPCDFSGELIPPISATATSKNQKVIVTSFNGGYIGYVTPEKYFNLKKYETRDMNFFGPYTGTYLQELIKLIIDKSTL